MVPALQLTVERTVQDRQEVVAALHPKLRFRLGPPAVGVVVDRVGELSPP